jgi:hypothetical protein
MIRFLFRFFGLVFLALGFIFLVYDGTKSIADQHLYIAQLRPVIQGVAVWADPIVQGFLGAPTWLVLAIVGMLLILLGRKKRRLIGYARD